MTQTSNEDAAPTRTTAECCAVLECLLAPEFFRALGDPRRQAILLKLATTGGTWTVSRVAEELPINISVVSRHLAQLRDAGILAADRQGKEVHYSVRYDTVVKLLRQLADAIEGCCPRDSRDHCCTKPTENEKEKETH